MAKEWHGNESKSLKTHRQSHNHQRKKKNTSRPLCEALNKLSWKKIKTRCLWKSPEKLFNQIYLSKSRKIRQILISPNSLQIKRLKIQITQINLSKIKIKLINKTLLKTKIRKPDQHKAERSLPLDWTWSWSIRSQSKDFQQMTIRSLRPKREMRKLLTRRSININLQKVINLKSWLKPES